MKKNIEYSVVVSLSFVLTAMLPCVNLNSLAGQQTDLKPAIVNAEEIETNEIIGSIEEAEIALEAESSVYTGDEIKPKITVSFGEDQLTEDTDYTIEYSNNINAGTATVKIVGCGEYDGEVIREFTIEQKELADEDIEIDLSNLKTFDFNGKYRTPIIIFKYNGRQLNPMADYHVQYENNFFPGTASVIIEGIDNFKGKVIKNFNITKKQIDSVTIRTEFNTAKQLIVKVNNGSYAMTLNKDYSYTIYTDEIGNITITFTGLGNNYEGTYVRKIAAENNPNRPLPPTVKRIKIKKVKNIKVRKSKVTWERKETVAGYQIRYAANRKFDKAKIKTIKKNVNKYIIGKLKKKKKYYIQVRAYKVFNHENYYGKWSKTKKIKIKK